jgi:hypothetical protein
MPHSAAEKRLKCALMRAMAAGVQGREFKPAMLDVFKDPRIAPAEVAGALKTPPGQIRDSRALLSDPRTRSG